MEDSIRKELDKQNWGQIIKRLTLHAHFRLKFWNLLSEKGIKGYSPEDIALEAISLVYSGEWHWDPKKSDLLPYLKFHVVNGLVANLARNKEVTSAVNFEDIDVEFDYSIEAEINAKVIAELIRNQLKNEGILLELFDGLYSGMKRKDLCDHLKISTKEFDNEIRRLKSRMLRFKNLVILK